MWASDFWHLSKDAGSGRHCPARTGMITPLTMAAYVFFDACNSRSSSAQSGHGLALDLSSGSASQACTVRSAQGRFVLSAKN